MSLSPAISKALNEQINHEMSASYHYLAMSSYFEARDLKKFAALFREQSAEETQHAMKIYDYVFTRGGEVRLGNIDALVVNFQTAEEVIRTALKMEQGVTAQINAIHALAVKEMDVATQVLMNWFVDEQVEEEDKFQTLITKVAAAGEDDWRLLILEDALDLGVAE
ncbi:MAG: ferritin [Rhodobacteraceae bacterium]|nr:ferritin [Paracoccaceae bacterium]